MPVVLTESIRTYSARWYGAIGRRRSRRRYDPARAIPDELMSRFRSVCAGFTPFAGARAEILPVPAASVFWGIAGSYGKIKGATVVIAFIGETGGPNYQAEVGYTGEGVILEATALGLDTCWVGGFFRPGLVRQMLRLRKNERVLAVTPVGFAGEKLSAEETVMTGFGLKDRRKPLDSMATGQNSREWAEWVRISLEAARLAPSAMNRQPWGFHVEPDGVTISVRTGEPQLTVSKRLDCGIAMLHLEVAALNCGVEGSWEWLNPPGVAGFNIR